jgi:hypothetical protein
MEVTQLFSDSAGREHPSVSSSILTYLYHIQTIGSKGGAVVFPLSMIGTTAYQRLNPHQCAIINE